MINTLHGRVPLASERQEMGAAATWLAGWLSIFKHLSSSLPAASMCAHGPRQFWNHTLPVSDLRAKTTLLHWVYPEDTLGKGPTGLASHSHVWTNHGDPGSALVVSLSLWIGDGICSPDA